MVAVWLHWIVLWEHTHRAMNNRKVVALSSSLLRAVTSADESHSSASHLESVCSRGAGEDGRCFLQVQPRIRRDYPLNLSISLGGGKETNKYSLSNGE